jgi:uncharacterized membrane protein HdeD (DUF308 family)
MADITTATNAPDQSARWKWSLALGVLLLLLGLAGAGATTLLELTTLMVFGPMLFASSVVQLLMAFVAETRKECLLHFAAASVEAILGILLMAHPVPVATDMVVLIAVFLLVSGLVRLARSLVSHSPARGWIVMAGVGALVLSVCVWLKLPVSGLWAVGLCMALDFLCHGASWSAVALAESKQLSLPGAQEAPAGGSARKVAS